MRRSPADQPGRRQSDRTGRSFRLPGKALQGIRLHLRKLRGYREGNSLATNERQLEGKYRQGLLRNSALHEVFRGLHGTGAGAGTGQGIEGDGTAFDEFLSDLKVKSKDVEGPAHSSEITPWMKRSGFWDYLIGFDLETIQGAMLLPKEYKSRRTGSEESELEGQLEIICESVDRLLRRGVDFASNSNGSNVQSLLPRLARLTILAWSRRKAEVGSAASGDVDEQMFADILTKTCKRWLANDTEGPLYTMAAGRSQGMPAEITWSEDSSTVTYQCSRLKLEDLQKLARSQYDIAEGILRTKLLLSVEIPPFQTLELFDNWGSRKIGYSFLDSKESGEPRG
ncbi:hypothetical protein ABW20_dc0110462 [Dactylellina cionopaga]|nr:hypothetical protein ABW20_dc0110462 [Dactylellina cionopaga]